jgi:hypothetical protein
MYACIPGAFSGSARRRSSRRTALIRALFEWSGVALEELARRLEVFRANKDLALARRGEAVR